MPVQFEDTHLYDIQELLGPLQEAIKKTPTVQIFPVAEDRWSVAIFDGLPKVNGKRLGYLRERNGTTPQISSSREDAFNTVSPYKDELNILL